jgi:tetratricopeptide (TPR) repeat protein
MLPLGALTMRAISVAVVMLCAVSAARGTPGEAKAHYEQAAKFYDLGDFKEALAEFKAAFLAHDDPVYLFNIAQCFRMLGDNEKAAMEYRAYLRRSPNAPNRARVEEFVAIAEKEIQRKANNVSPTGTMRPNPSAAPEPATVTAPPPKPVEPAPSATPPVAVTNTDTDAPRPIYKRWYLWVPIAVVVVAAAAVAVFFATQSHDAAIPSTTSGFTLLNFH